MPIIPDTKDWTWATRQPCEECGFDPTALDVVRTGDRVRANATGWAEVLARPDVVVRPDDATWSPLEYACHVRDVLTLFRERLALMLGEDDPLFANWDQDATAVEQDYGAQDPAEVGTALVREAGLTAAAFDAVPDDAWGRTGRRNDGAVFSVATFAAYFLHDIEHHAYDVRRV
ncbi:DinB family protein [Mumia flava]|uniref:DinB family protein n=1 Tax=Mumia flava TaxID=1348852 RepID=A0A0B2BNQ5_9ACTN|nr:DinB family protein [Mumia flava]